MLDERENSNFEKDDERVQIIRKPGWSIMRYPLIIDDTP